MSINIQLRYCTSKMRVYTHIYHKHFVLMNTHTITNTCTHTHILYVHTHILYTFCINKHTYNRIYIVIYEFHNIQWENLMRLKLRVSRNLTQFAKVYLQNQYERKYQNTNMKCQQTQIANFSAIWYVHTHTKHTNNTVNSC